MRSDAKNHFTTNGQMTLNNMLNSVADRFLRHSMHRRQTTTDQMMLKWAVKCSMVLSKLWHTYLRLQTTNLNYKQQRFIKKITTLASHTGTLIGRCQQAYQGRLLTSYKSTPELRALLLPARNNHKLPILKPDLISRPTVGVPSFALCLEWINGL